MQLFSISENGALRKVTKMELVQNRVYLVDDIKIIYLWFGLKASSKKKDMSIKKAKILSKKKQPHADIQIINQNKEYGSFLAIMDILKKGISSSADLKRRPELEIEIEDTIELIDAGLEPDFEAELTLAAHIKSKEKRSYRELCEELAKLQLMLSQDKATQKEIKEKAKEIFNSSSTYEELCWLIAELGNLKQKNN